MQWRHHGRSLIEASLSRICVCLCASFLGQCPQASRVNVVPGTVQLALPSPQRQRDAADEGCLGARRSPRRPGPSVHPCVSA